MKQFKTLLLITILSLFAVQISNAQTKVGHVDTKEILAKFPAMIEAQKQLEKIGVGFDTDYKKLVDEYQEKLKKYEAESKTVSEVVNQEHQKDLQEMLKRITDLRDSSQKQLQEKQTEILTPIVEKVKSSIKKVGKAKKFQYILDSSSLLLSDGVDLTGDVKKDLGFN